MGDGDEPEPVGNLTLTYHCSSESDVLVIPEVMTGLKAGDKVTIEDLGLVDGAEWPFEENFIGWTYDGVIYPYDSVLTMPDHDVTLEALLRPVGEVTGEFINFASPGMLKVILRTIENLIESDKVAAINIPDGYVGNCWKKDGKGESYYYYPGDIIEVDGEIELTLYQKFEPTGEGHILSFTSTEDISLPEPIELAEGEKYPLVNLEQVLGKPFIGWADSEDVLYTPGCSFTMPDHDVVLDLKYENGDFISNKITYKIGSNTTSFDIPFDYSRVALMNLPEGYVYTCWEDMNAEVPIYKQPGDIVNISMNLTYKASIGGIIPEEEITPEKE